jgi:hypothetical protein
MGHAGKKAWGMRLLKRWVPVGAALAVFGIGLLATHLLGPFYLYGDPCYVYLFSSLGMLQGLAPGHIDHPGTTMQELGAVVILARWLVTRLIGGDQTIAESVVAHPEAYLSAINVVLLALSAGAVAVTVRVLINRTGRVWLMLLVPALLIASTDVLLSLANVVPDHLLLPIGLMVILLALPPPEVTRRTALLRGAAMGVLLGAGFVSKITFAPMFLFVLALPGIGAMAVAVLATVISGLVFTIPIWSSLNRVFDFIVLLATHQGQYGHGPSGLPPFDFLWAQATKLLWLEPFYLVAMVLFGSAALVLLIRGNQGRSAWSRVFLVALGVIACQLFITAIRPGPRYLVPSIGVIAVMMPLAIDFVFRRAGTAVGAMLFGGFVAFFGAGLWPDLGAYQRSFDAFKRLRQIAADQNCRVIPHFYSYELEAVLNFGQSYHRVFGPELSKAYPNFISYNVFTDYFENFADNVTADVAKLLESGQALCLLGSADLKSTATVDVTPIARDGVFHLYRVEAIR